MREAVFFVNCIGHVIKLYSEMNSPLTQEEISEIIIESENPEYKIENYFHFNPKKNSILKVSKHSGLIFFKGNAETGYDHIMIGHHPLFKVPRWKNSSELDEPSQFPLGGIPILYFLRVSDAIYKIENLNTEKNKNPHLYDLYIGEFTDLMGRRLNYRLLLYKNTKIVHNLFSTSKKYNRKKVFDLAQGFCSGKIIDHLGVEEYSIPFYDFFEVKRLNIKIQLKVSTGEENWFAEIFNDKEVLISKQLIETRMLTKFYSFHDRRMRLDYHEDLTWLSEKVKKLLKEPGV